MVLLSANKMPRTPKPGLAGRENDRVQVRALPPCFVQALRKMLHAAVTDAVNRIPASQTMSCGTVFVCNSSA